MAGPRHCGRRCPIAGFLVPGPVAVVAGVGASGAPLFFGHARQPGIQIDIEHNIQPVQCDIGGDEPLDDYYSGRSGVASGTFPRYNSSVYQIMSQIAAARLGIGTAGVDMPGDVGTMLQQEGAAFPLWLVFPYSPKPLFNLAGNVLIAGYHFRAAHLAQDSQPDLGPRTRNLRLVWRCRRALDETVTTLYGTGAWTLFDHDMSGIAGVQLF